MALCSCLLLKLSLLKIFIGRAEHFQLVHVHVLQNVYGVDIAARGGTLAQSNDADRTCVQ